MPWVNRRWNGSRSSAGARPRSASALVKNRAYIRCSTACSAPPMYWSTGIHWRDRVERNGASVVPRVAEAQEVPGRVDEGVHGVGLAHAPGPPHVGHVVLRKPSWYCSGDSPVGRNSTSSGASTGSWSSGTGDHAVVGAVDDRDRAAPEPLAGQQPVAQAEVDLALADALLLEPVDRLRPWPRRPPRPSSHRLLMAGPSPGVGLARPSPRAAATVRMMGRSNARGEVPVALVLAGHGHDRPGAVGGQHVVGEVDGHRLAGERVGGVGAGEAAPLGRGRPRSRGGRSRRCCGRVSTNASTSARCSSVVMAATSGCSGASTQKVMPKLVSGRVVNTRMQPRSVGRRRDRHVELGALGAADPVALLADHPVGPVQAVEVVEQLLGVVGDAEVPLLQVALLDHVAGALAGAVGQHLLVGQHRLAAGAPVDRGVGAVGEAGLEEAQEDPLRSSGCRTGSWLLSTRRQS